jgi:hypothetical protein
MRAAGFTVLFIAASAVLTAAAVTDAPTRHGALSDASHASPLGSPAKNQFDKLFQAQPTRPRPDGRVESRAKPKVVCGLLVIPVDPRIDPRIAVAPPNSSVEFTIQKVQPPVCWSR